MIATFLGGLAARFGATALKWLAVVVAVLGLLLYVRHSGRVAERMDGAAKALEVSRGRRKLDREIDAMPDADLDNLLRAPRDRHKAGRR
jgi:hypothetical protein